jgi:hypothetical protein
MAISEKKVFSIAVSKGEPYKTRFSMFTVFCSAGAGVGIAVDWEAKERTAT